MSLCLGSSRLTLNSKSRAPLIMSRGMYRCCINWSMVLQRTHDKTITEKNRIGGWYLSHHYSLSVGPETRQIIFLDYWGCIFRVLV